jgi:hypothetical protein
MVNANSEDVHVMVNANFEDKTDFPGILQNANFNPFPSPSLPAALLAGGDGRGPRYSDFI